MNKSIYDENNDYFYSDNKNLSDNFLDQVKKQNLSNTKNFWDFIEHRNDNIQIGYDYENNGIFNKCLTPFILKEKKRKQIMEQIEKLFVFMINHVKSIKKVYNYIVPRDYTYFN